MNKLMFFLLLFISTGTLYSQTTDTIFKDSSKLSYKSNYFDCEKDFRERIQIGSDSIKVVWLENNSEACFQLFLFLNEYNWDEESKEYALNAIDVVNSRPEFVLERILELYRSLRKDPTVLLKMNKPN